MLATLDLYSGAEMHVLAAHCREGGTVLRMQVAPARASRGSGCIIGPLQSSKI